MDTCNTSESTRTPLPYFLGCPAWNWPTWKGTIYPERATQKRWLHYYSTKFNSVEGNSIFYGIPSPETARRWVAETVDGFHIAPKFPRIVSHDKALVDTAAEMEAFLEVVSILHQGNRVGPAFLQLSPYFSPKQFPALKTFLQQLPKEFCFAVEVRHLDWFRPEIEPQLDGLLDELNMNRVIFDSRPLFSADPTDEYEVKSQGRKPKVPIRKQTTGQFPFLRLIGRNAVSLVDPWIDEWTDDVKAWIEAGLTPYVFTHSPNDEFAPEIARRFHKRLGEKLRGLPPLPDWEEPAPTQLDLF